MRFLCKEDERVEQSGMGIPMERIDEGRQGIRRESRVIIEDEHRIRAVRECLVESDVISACKPVILVIYDDVRGRISLAHGFHGVI